MGIPYWKPKEEEKIIKINRQNRINNNTRQRIRHIRLRNRNNTTSDTYPTTLLSQPYHLPIYILRRRHLPNINNNNSIRHRRAEIDSRIHQRYLDKEELLNQLEITTSLLDQFISIRQVSDLSTILSATSIDMEDINTAASSSATLANINNSILNNNNNNQNNHTLLPSSRSASSLSSLSSSPFITLNRSSTSENNLNQPQHPLTIISPHRINNNSNNLSSPSIDELVDMVMSNPPYSSRLARLDESIANAHHRVTDQLELLGW
ncbi:unnamed protein product [Cunninghamella blakesleeana]